MILIKDGRLVDPASGVDDMLDLVIEDHKIKHIGKFKSSDDYEQIINAKGLVVAPGLVDVHVHFRDPGFTYKEDIISGSKAAARGGFTSVVMMANTKPVIDHVDVLKEVAEKCKRADIHVYPSACITKRMAGKELTDFKELIKHGAVGLSDDGLPLMDASIVKAAMDLSYQLNIPLSFHEEDSAFVGTAGIHNGNVAKEMGYIGADELAEDVMTARDCMIAIKTKAPINIQHISSKNSIAMVRLAKSLGANISAEASAHHFTLDENAVLTYGTLAKMNPPLRTSQDRYAIIEGMKDGTIDIIASDHAPHSEEEKNREFNKAPSGIIGLETTLSLGISNLVRKGILTMNSLIGKMTYLPAQRFHLDAGYLKEGGPADIVLFDERKEVLYHEFVSKSSNSPFKDMPLYGEVMMTICAGKIVYGEDSDRIGAPQ